MYASGPLNKAMWHLISRYVISCTYRKVIYIVENHIQSIRSNMFFIYKFKFMKLAFYVVQMLSAKSWQQYIYIYPFSQNKT